VALSSGTDALLASLMALGIGPGDRVLTTPFSFFATAGVVARLGARPVFMDVQRDTFEMDLSRLESCEKEQIKAVIPVHLFGHVMELDPLLEWAGERPVIEDAAQALGARDRRGRPPGSLGTCAAISFFPTKNLGALGDAGMLVTRDGDLARLVARLRVHGQLDSYRHTRVGGNFRMDALQAAALGAALPFLPQLIGERREHAALYERLFKAAGLAGGPLVLPRLDPGHAYHQYVIRIPEGRRDGVLGALKARNIGAGVYYPLPLHLQPCFKDLGYHEGDFPEAEQAAREVLALPVFPGLQDQEQRRVVEAVAACF